MPDKLAFFPGLYPSDDPLSFHHARQNCRLFWVLSLQTNATSLPASIIPDKTALLLGGPLFDLPRRQGMLLVKRG